MAVAVRTKLTLADARAFIDRAVDKTREFGRSACFVVMDSGGNIVSLSALEGTPVTGVSLARAKAYLAAVDLGPSIRRAGRWGDGSIIYDGFKENLRRPIFPGAGGIPIVRDGWVVGTMSTGPGVGGMDAVVPDVEGKVNLEDYIVCHALGIPYQQQHPEPMAQMLGPSDRGPNRPTGLTLADARVYADKAMAAATRLGIKVGVGIVDEVGLLLQLDLMDGGPLAAPDLCEAKALTALHFQMPTAGMRQMLDPGELDQVAHAMAFRMVTVAGGRPMVRDGEVIGAIGVTGNTPAKADQIAAEAIG